MLPLLLFYSQPLNVVLGLFSDELHALQDVSDVIDASLLDLQDLGGPVQIKNSIGRLGNQAHKLLGEEAQGSVVPRPLSWRFGRCGARGGQMKPMATFQTDRGACVCEIMSAESLQTTLPLTPWAC